MGSDDFVRRLSRQQVTAEALKARRAIGLTDEPVFSLLPIIETDLVREIPGYELHVDPQEEMGSVEAYVANFPPRVVLSERTYQGVSRNDPRCRFTAAHEIGHLWLHLDYLQDAEALAARDSHKLSLISSRCETQANWFAADFLMPEAVVRQCDDPDILSRHCGVSRTAAELRMRELGLWPKKSPTVVSGFESLLEQLRAGNARGIQKVIPRRLARAESWGTLLYDSQTDEFSAEVASGATPAPSSPVGIGWVIIGGCNQACIQCYGNVEELPKERLSAAECTRIVDAIARAKIMRVVISGGEPLLHPDVYTVIDRLAARNIGVVLGTNGSLLNPENVRRVAACVRVEISLDAADAELNNQIRPSRGTHGDAFVESVKAIELCLKSGLNVKVLTTLNVWNQHQLVQMANLLNSVGVRDWALSWTIAAGRAVNIIDEIRPQKDIVEQNLAEARVRFPQLNIRYSHRGPEYNRFYFLILPDGQIATQDVVLGHKITFGSALDTPIEAVWTEANFDINAHFKKWVADRVFPVA